MSGSEPSRGGRQHGEEVRVVDVASPAPQLGAVVNDAADPGADQRPAADGIGPHEVADRPGERDVGVEAPVGVRRSVEEGRRAGGPNGYVPKMVAGPPELRQRAPVGSRVLPHPPVVPSNGGAPEVGRRGPTGIGDPVRPPCYGIRHPRGRPTVQPDGCSSSCLSRRSIPSRMKDEVFLYLV
jgi:hypothetical protein